MSNNAIDQLGKWAAKELGCPVGWKLRVTYEGAAKNVTLIFAPDGAPLPAEMQKKAKPPARRKARSPK